MPVRQSLEKCMDARLDCYSISYSRPIFIVSHAAMQPCSRAAIRSAQANLHRQIEVRWPGRRVGLIVEIEVR